MKYLITTLFYLFLAACSDVDLGGFTESIVKNADTSYLNSSPTTQEPVLKKTAYPLDEDLSSLDEEELREKLMNSYPWPLAKSGEINDGTFDLPHNPYTGEIKDIRWNNLAPIIEEDPNHEYGFDSDPLDKDPYVYISTKKGENVLFKPHLSNIAYDKYCLIHYPDKVNPKEYLEEIKDGETHTILSEYIGSESIFLLYGATNKNEKRCYKPTKKEYFKAIKILPYNPVTKNFIYVEINGKKNDSWDVQKEQNGFTKDSVIKYFNKVYNQAVVYPNIKYGEKDAYGVEQPYVINDLIEVNMTEPTDDAYNKLIINALEIISNQLNQDNTDDPFWHFIYVINKERKRWDLEKCSDANYNLNKCVPTFNPENDYPKAKYYMYRKENKPGCKDNGIKIGAENSINIEIRTKPSGELDNDGNMVRDHYAYYNGKKIEYTECDVLYTDDGYPVIPSSDGVYGGLAALSLRLKGSYDLKKGKYEIKIHDKYLPFGSIIIVPRGKGPSAHYTLMHELGHSFGLTDAQAYALYKKKEYDGKNNENSYTNTYASPETNLMAWQQPTGKKIRYRETPIACTGGTTYYNGPTPDLNYYLGAVERLVGGKGENQWECIRNCYLNNFSYFERKNFWEKKVVCEEDNDKNRTNTNQNKFQEIFEQSMKGKIIDLDKIKK